MIGINLAEIPVDLNISDPIKPENTEIVTNCIEDLTTQLFLSSYKNDKVEALKILKAIEEQFDLLLGSELKPEEITQFYVLTTKLLNYYQIVSITKTRNIYTANYIERTVYNLMQYNQLQASLYLLNQIALILSQGN